MIHSERAVNWQPVFLFGPVKRTQGACKRHLGLQGAGSPGYRFFPAPVVWAGVYLGMIRKVLQGAR